MNLIIDIGNSRTKIALYNGAEMVDSTATSHLNGAMEEFLEGREVDRAIVSSVGKEDNLQFEFPTLKLTHETPLPFTLQYNTKSTLGKDRIALATAAYYKYPAQDCLIIDAGTCLTFDFIDRSGNYWGGGISPGMEMRLKSLHHFTARLPEIKYRTGFDLIGNNTENSILSGAVGGILRETEATIQAYKERYPDIIVLITGGDQSIFEDFTKNSIFAPPDFLLSGLNYILEYNAERF